MNLTILHAEYCISLRPRRKGPFALGDTNRREAAHMRLRHTVAEAHMQRNVHTVFATLPPVFRLPLSKMDHAGSLF